MIIENTTYKLSFLEMTIAKIRDYNQLVKMRLSLLVVFSSAMGYLYASAGSINWSVFIGLLIGGFLVTASSNAFNQAFEKDIDAKMKRTKERPVPSGRMSFMEAIAFGTFVGFIGFILLFKLTNPACAFMASLALISYVFLYTPMKRITHLATFVGAIPGALPFAIGWFAVTGIFSPEIIYLFLIQFVWQFPHTWAIAWLLRDDYNKVNIKLNPFRNSGDKRTAYYIMIYTLILIPVSLMPFLYSYTHWQSAIFILLLGLYFLKTSYNLFKQQNDKKAKGVLIGSIVYLPLVQIVLVLDKVFIS
ncbi:MAG TPA: protoheme IX farnesyltransferase [Bacteroidetes bacterium]|nr:protoheme IX farnesyltransferase [Bacteroidota bacterium]